MYVFLSHGTVNLLTHQPPAERSTSCAVPAPAASLPPGGVTGGLTVQMEVTKKGVVSSLSIFSLYLVQVLKLKHAETGSCSVNILVLEVN